MRPLQSFRETVTVSASTSSADLFLFLLAPLLLGHLLFSPRMLESRLGRRADVNQARRCRELSPAVEALPHCAGMTHVTTLLKRESVL